MNPHHGFEESAAANADVTVRPAASSGVIQMPELEHWRFDSQIGAKTGEADLFIVTARNGGALAVAKFYRIKDGKPMKPNEAVLDSLKGLSSSRLIKVHDHGWHPESARYYEVMEYCRDGEIGQLQSGGGSMRSWRSRC